MQNMYFILAYASKIGFTILEALLLAHTEEGQSRQYKRNKLIPLFNIQSYKTENQGAIILDLHCQTWNKDMITQFLFKKENLRI